MDWKWGDFWSRSGKWLKVGWLVTAGLVALYIGVIEPRQMAREVSASRSTGLGAVAGGSILPWRQKTVPAARFTGGFSGADVDKVQVAAMTMSADSSEPVDRKLVRTCAMYLIVQTPAETAEKIRMMAEQMGGYLENSQINGNQFTGNASLTIRVPAARIEEARTAIRKLALRVDSDRLEAQDMTKDYVDREARLRNLHAQEEQYLGIMKRATTVKDTLEVSEQLNTVRGQIEEEQAEFNALSKQVETVAITVSLNAEADAQVFGLSWRPLYRLKMAVRDGLDGLGDYLAAMTSFAFYLPTVLLWLATILVGAAAGWRILRWAARVLFVPRKPALTEEAAK
jgi:Domain of unknown function (DUF4349)